MLSRSRAIGFLIIVSLWNLKGVSAALPPNFRAIEKAKTRISQLRDFSRSCGKTSVRLLNRGPGHSKFTVWTLLGRSNGHAAKCKLSRWYVKNVKKKTVHIMSTYDLKSTAPEHEQMEYIIPNAYLIGSLNNLSVMMSAMDVSTRRWAIWGVLCQKKVKRAGISKNPEILRGVITCPGLWYTLLAQHSSYDFHCYPHIFVCLFVSICCG